MKKYYGIIFAVVYAMLFRVLVEYNIIEFNSLDYLIIVPIIMGYLPFVIDPKVFADSCLKAALFPLISSFLFFIFCFQITI